MTPAAESAGYRILVIDDNASIHEDFRKILKGTQADYQLQGIESALFGTANPSVLPCKFEIDCASQGEEGLALVLRALAENRPYALAFVDGRMPPGWDGIETIKHIWREYPELQIVFCTAYADYSWQEIRRTIGETDSLMILKKPFDNVEVLQLAHTLSRKWELNHMLQGRLNSMGEMVHRSTEEKDRVSALLETAIKHSPTGIIVSSALDGKILWANPAATNIVDLNRKAGNGEGPSIHKGHWEFFKSDGSPYPAAELPLSRAIQKGDITREEEFIIRDAQGRDKWLSANAAPIRDSGGAIYAGILLFQDITERKHAQKEHERLQTQLSHAQKLESVGRLAGGIAHDFNNLLQVIGGNIQLLQMTIPQDHPDFARLHTVYKSIARAAQLVSQLLLFSRKAETKRQQVNLNHAVQEAVAMLERTIPKMIKIEVRVERNIWPIDADPMQIEQILLNLGANAVDAMPDGGELTIETANITLNEEFAGVNLEMMPGNYVQMSFSDTGCGMNQETLAHLYDPFFTTKGVGKGTGLGLSSVYGIVKGHGGHIQCFSEIGKGTTFKLYWQAVVGPKPAPEIICTDNVSLPGGTETILVVDDEAGVRELAKEMLQLRGYTTLEAGSGEEAISVFSHNRDLVKMVLMDLNMPGMGGLKCMHELLRIDPQARILISSGYSATGKGSDTMRAGAYGYIGKPYRLTDLLCKVRQVLDIPPLPVEAAGATDFDV